MKISDLRNDHDLWSLFILSIRLFIPFIRGLLYGYPLVFIDSGVTIKGRSKLEIGPYSRLHSHSYIDARSTDGIKIGNRFKLGAYSRIVASGSISTLGAGITIGQGVGVGEFCYFGGHGGLQIGDHCIFGQYCSIHPQNHIFELESRKPFQTTTELGIKIDSGSWFGAKVTILDGATMKGPLAVAAGSVVTKGKYSSHCLYGGVPAQRIKSLVNP